MIVSGGEVTVDVDVRYCTPLVALRLGHTVWTLVETTVEMAAGMDCVMVI